MPRLPQLTEDPTGLLDRTKAQLGRVPNLYAALANGPAALAGYLAMREELTRGALGPRLREQIALLVAQENGCTYCVSAHTLRGSRMGLGESELRRTREAADDTDPHADAVLSLTREVVRTHGRVDDATLARVRAAGVTDAELAEVVAHVALNTLSNYFNHLAQPELDFPEVQA
ncbi:carboxymuconolactone decarboxylase family protein [Streptomyces sp. H10-C2]|uniref:carboxymuconolactone decarboxylase family protein n=1 Tax=unclassified Streptomyces TaxID=2593676 RepID=UPI0024B8AFD1|nr:MULTISPECIES: carboxymuconolactone decarboxylase family protein [unclassified Streptomyces]MDJ0347372.1 carboxymuconolactone decarboxylase family protein [Streptomyces sp. PH10-H1]MDJ0375615.1 carboxymuconolactone decarboxylase family protein [Streptomyces sp. H10-C2]